MRARIFSAITIALLVSADADVLKEAHVSQVIKDVQVLPTNAAPRPATTTDIVRQGTAVRTGTDSRAELTFTDLTIARLGANTIFSFDEGTRTVDLSDGAILLRVPKGSGGAKVKTAAITAAITGTTVMVEYHKNSYAKFICIEGTMRVFLKAHFGESVLVHAGQMLIANPNATRLSDPVDVDVDRLVRTSLLLGPPFGPLGSETLMANAAQDQLGKKAAGTLIDTNLVIFGRGTLVTLTDPSSLDVIDQARAAQEEPTPTPTAVPRATATPTPVPRPTATPTPVPRPTATPTPVPQPTPTPTPVPQPTPTPTPIVPTPTPSPSVQPTPTKFGTPPVITSQVPYTINSATTIQTDPAITSNGTTDFGKIYRDPTTEGMQPSGWMFGTTTAFDTQSQFDAQINVEAIPFAAFKFVSLVLAGDPAIVIPSGGATNLALISVGDITSAAPGGTLTFSGIKALILATQAGSITLGPELTFSNIPSLLLHARGPSSDVTMNSAVNSPSGFANLRAERNVTVNGAEQVSGFSAYAGNDFVAGSGQVQATDVSITGGNNVNFNSAQFAVGTAAVNSVGMQAGNVVNIDLANDTSVFANAANVFVQAGSTGMNPPGTINITNSASSAPTQLTFQSNANVAFVAGTGGIQASNIAFNMTPPSGQQAGQFSFFSSGDLNVETIQTADNVSANGLINASGSVVGVNVGAGSSIQTGSALTGIQTINAGSTISAGTTLTSPQVIAGGNITADTVSVQNISAPTGVLTAGNGGIIPFFAAGAGAAHQFTIDSIVAAGGIDFTGAEYVSNNFAAPQNGGLLTVTANTLTFASGSGISFANFTGSDAPAAAPGQSPIPGNGGTFRATVNGPINVNSFVVATTGRVPNSGTFAGAGGTVSFESTGGAINVSGFIQVSSDDARSAGSSPPPTLRESASGGNINLQSDLTTGTGININQGASVLSLLSRTAPGPGGTIRLSTKGSNIVVNGTVEADQGNVIMDQNDPPGVVPQMNIDAGANLIGASFNAHSAGDLNLAANGAITLSFPNVSLLADNSITWQVDRTTLNGLTSLSVAAPTINLNAAAPFRFVLPATGTATFAAGAGGIQGSNVAFGSADGSGATQLNPTSGGDNNLFSIAGAQNVSATTGNVKTTGGLNAVTVNIGGSLTVGSHLISEAAVTAHGDIKVTGLLSSPLVTAGGNGTANGNVTADGIAVKQLDAAAGVLTAGSGGIVPLVITPDGATLPHVFNVASIVSPKGINFSGDQFGGVGDNFSGGNLTINASTLSFATGGIGAVSFDGAGSSSPFPPPNGDGGNGGTFTANSTGDIVLNGATISATSGLNAANVSFAGAGGNVTLSSSHGTITDTVSSITVSSDDLLTDFQNNPIAGHRSASGGNITLFSGLTTGVGISVSGDSRLDSLLDAAAPGPGGSISLSTAGSDIVIRGAVEADRGTITLTQQAAAGEGSPAIGLYGSLIAQMINIDTKGAFTFPGVINAVSFPNTATPAADGGSLNISTGGDLVISGVVDATSGFTNATAPSGNGGSVSLASSAGTVAVSSAITVSSADSSSGSPNRRSSKGGTLRMSSGKSGTESNRAVAINVTSSGQLLSLLDAAAPGPGGAISIKATGANSDVNIAGKVQADRGDIDIRHTGDGGQVTIGNTVGAPGAMLSADVIKAAALGSNGVLNIGNSNISANSLLYLYSTGSNGQLNFVANCTLSSGTAMHLAADAVTINKDVVVNIAGSGGPANVYTNAANYSGFGGNGTTNGTFSGKGAKDPLPLATAPPLPAPPAGGH